MDYSRLVRLNQGLFAGTALLAVGSIVAGAAGGPVFNTIASILAGLEANNLGALIEKLRNSSDVLRNEDIAKAAGRSVGLALGKISPNYSNKESLENFANKIEEYWVQWAKQAKTLNLFETLQEDQLYQIFGQKPEQFTEYQVLPKEEWREVVTWLFQQGCEKGDLGDTLENYQDVITDLTTELAANFNKHFRQVLKDDAAKGGKPLPECCWTYMGRLWRKLTRFGTIYPKSPPVRIFVGHCNS